MRPDQERDGHIEHLEGALRLGTRGSPLAVIQARLVRERLIAAHPDLPPPEIVSVITTGDKVQDRPLREIGGKGLFTKELDVALLDGRIDIAVHSMKDVETRLPDGLVVDCLLPREDPRDALIVGPGVEAGGGIGGLAPSARVGTSSLRRAAQILSLRPDIEIVSFRGNVDTRLKRLTDGEAEATLLAVAGLNRLGRADEIAAVLDPEEILPSVGQGAIGVARRADDVGTGGLLTPLHDRDTGIQIATERAMLASLDGSCQTPVGGLARLRDGRVTIDGLLAAPDGSRIFRTSQSGSVDDAAALGTAAGKDLRAQAGDDFLSALENFVPEQA